MNKADETEANVDGAVEPWRQICITLVVFILPLADTTTVTINRMAKGRSPFIGGKDHTTHHLSYAGLTDAHVVTRNQGGSIDLGTPRTLWAGVRFGLR